MSRFTFFGRRKSTGRRNEEQRSGYVDRYSPGLLALLVFFAGLNVLDALFTMMILQRNGQEFNPIVRALIGLVGDKFWIWKFILVSFGLIFLCLHCRFRFVVILLVSVTSIYLATVIYEVVLLSVH